MPNCAFWANFVWINKHMLTLKMKIHSGIQHLQWWKVVLNLKERGTYILDVLRQHKQGPRDERCRKCRLRQIPSRRSPAPPSHAGQTRRCPGPACASTWTSPEWRKRPWVRIFEEMLMRRVQKSPGGRKRRSLPPSGASRAGWGVQRGCRCKRGQGGAPLFFGSDHAVAWFCLGCLTAAMLNS